MKFIINTNNNYMMNMKFMGEYVSPLCQPIALITEEAILTMSTPVMLGEFDDNDIFIEEF